LKTLGFQGDMLRAEAMLVRILAVRRSKGYDVQDLRTIHLVRDIKRAREWETNALHN